MSRDTSVDLATGYGLDGPGIESRWGRDFSPTFRPALGTTHPASCKMSTGSFQGVKRPGRGADHQPLLVQRSRKSRATPLASCGPSGILGITLPLPFSIYEYTFTALRRVLNEICGPSVDCWPALLHTTCFGITLPS
jgi:hypothetical protein